MASWRDNVKKVVPYTPGEQPKTKDIVKLNTNENPYPPAPGVLKALSELDMDLMRKYPDPAITELVHAIAVNYGVSDDMVFVGVGSDDVIAMAFMTFFNSDKPVLFPDISYSFYKVWAALFGVKYELQPLKDDFSIDVNDYKKPNGGIIFPNPNAPTSIAMGLSEVEEIVKASSGSVVIVDEAYVDFGATSALPLVSKYDNVLVVQTFSKSRQMAGARIGFAIGNPELIKAINDVKYSFNSYTLSYPIIKMGVAAISDKAYFEEMNKKVIDTRAEAEMRLKELGYSFPKSSANFIFASHEKHNAKDIFNYLRAKNIFVRYFDQPRIDNYMRITIGTPEQMEVLYKALKEYNDEH